MEDESENARLMKWHNVLKGEPRTFKGEAIFDSIGMLLILEYRRVIDWIKVFELKSVLEDAISLQKYILFFYSFIGDFDWLMVLHVTSMTQVSKLNIARVICDIIYIVFVVVTSFFKPYLS